MILSLDLPPGAVLSEAELTRRLDCGRTPLREALQRLASEYLVVTIPRRGITISELSLTDYVQLIEAVSHLEGIAAKLATQRITDKEIAVLEEIISKAEEAYKEDDIFTVVELDYSFHYMISQIARNRYLADATKRLHRLTSRFIILAWKNGDKKIISNEEHRKILSAIKARKGSQAKQRTFEHTQNAKERILNAL